MFMNIQIGKFGDLICWHFLIISNNLCLYITREHATNLLSVVKQVVIPLAQLRSINSSTSRTNTAEKYIQVVSVDNHEFWFMGFVYYDSAVKNMQEILQESQSLRAQ
jgi:hypothetical protein